MIARSRLTTSSTMWADRALATGLAISRAVKTARVGLKDPKRPIGSFLFLGPTGVGKTELAKALAEFMFGSEDNLITLDMTEYQQEDSLNRLIGAAPGYVGFEGGGQLTDHVRQHPYTVVLFDEVEKAHRRIIDILPDREAATVTAWLTAHPSISVIARDRGAGYRQAATDGRPEATQVADRWHLMDTPAPPSSTPCAARCTRFARPLARAPSIQSL